MGIREEYTIREIRINMDMTIQEFSNLIGIKYNTYIKKERGERPFTYDEMVKVSQVLGISMDKIKPIKRRK